jgi:hypothetical protein
MMAELTIKTTRSGSQYRSPLDILRGDVKLEEIRRTAEARYSAAQQSNSNGSAAATATESATAAATSSAASGASGE